MNFHKSITKGLVLFTLGENITLNMCVKCNRKLGIHIYPTIQNLGSSVLYRDKNVPNALN